MMECTQFREEISKLRVEMEGILQELQTLMDAKLSLELEICAYRKLLEGEENRSVPFRAGGGGGTGGGNPSGGNAADAANKPSEKPTENKEKPKDSDAKPSDK